MGEDPAARDGINFVNATRRVTSPAETITMSFADDFMKANAEKRSRAGFDTRTHAVVQLTGKAGANAVPGVRS